MLVVASGISSSQRTAAPAAPQPEWAPSITPDNRGETAIAMLGTVATMLEPTPKNTPRPTWTVTPTMPTCEDAQGVTACRQGTATATNTPAPIRTALPELGPCGTPKANGTLPPVCLKGVGE